MKLRLMSPDTDTKPTSLKHEEGKMCQHHHISCQDTPSGGLGHHTWPQVQCGFASTHTELLLHKDSVCAVRLTSHTWKSV